MLVCKQCQSAQHLLQATSVFRMEATDVWLAAVIWNYQRTTFYCSNEEADDVREMTDRQI